MPLRTPFKSSSIHKDLAAPWSEVSSIHSRHRSPHDEPSPSLISSSTMNSVDASEHYDLGVTGPSSLLLNDHRVC